MKQLGYISPAAFESYNDLTKSLIDAGYKPNGNNNSFDVWQWLSDYWYIPAGALLLYILFKS